MAKIRNKTVHLEKLAARGASTATIIRLMMAANDLSLANEALGHWRGLKTNLRSERQRSAQLYFARIQFAHLWEGLKAIEAIQNDQFLLSIIHQCDHRTKDSYTELLRYLPGGTEYRVFKERIEKIRHKLVFHYDESGKWIQWAIADRSERPETRYSSITRGDSVFMWNFTVADQVIDSIVVRKIWGIPRDQSAQAGADEMTSYLHRVFLLFMDFCGEFLWKAVD